LRSTIEKGERKAAMASLSPKEKTTSYLEKLDIWFEYKEHEK
jgi:hypothetical protein